MKIYCKAKDTISSKTDSGSITLSAEKYHKETPTHTHTQKNVGDNLLSVVSDPGCTMLCL